MRAVQCFMICIQDISIRIFCQYVKVRDVVSGQAYAMKHMRLMGDTEAITDCMTEVNTLKKLRDVPTVITLRCTLISNPAAGISMFLDAAESTFQLLTSSGLGSKNVMRHRAPVLSSHSLENQNQNGYSMSFGMSRRCQFKEEDVTRCVPCLQV